MKHLNAANFALFCYCELYIYIALGSPSVTLDSRQTVRFPPVEGRVVSA